MDVTQTIRYEGGSYQEAMLLQRMLEAEGVDVEPQPVERERRELEDRQDRERRELEEREDRERRELEDRQEQERRRLEEQERRDQQVHRYGVTVDLVSTGTAAAIGTAVKKFLSRPRGKVKVDGETQAP
jgi:hypothetical protein